VLHLPFRGKNWSGQKLTPVPGVETQTWNSNYLGGWDQEDSGSD
jgi:hypothetical protein